MSEQSTRKCEYCTNLDNKDIYADIFMGELENYRCYDCLAQELVDEALNGPLHKIVHIE